MILVYNPSIFNRLLCQYHRNMRKSQTSTIETLTNKGNIWVLMTTIKLIKELIDDAFLSLLDTKEDQSNVCLSKHSYIHAPK